MKSSQPLGSHDPDQTDGLGSKYHDFDWKVCLSQHIQDCRSQTPLVSVYVALASSVPSTQPCTGEGMVKVAENTVEGAPR